MKEDPPTPERRILDYGHPQPHRASFSVRRVLIGVVIAILLLILYLCIFMITDSYWFRHLMGWV